MQHSRSSGPRRIATAVGLAALLVLGVTGTAMAKPYERSSSSESGTDPEFCGAYIQDWTFDTRWRIDQPKAVSHYQFFDYTLWWTFVSVVTNPVNGKSLTERFTGVHKERNPRILSGYDGVVVRFKITEQGRYTVRNQRGKIVFRDHGLVVGTAVFDTLNDSVPGGEVIGDIVILKDTWRHPDFDICQLADRLIG